MIIEPQQINHNPYILPESLKGTSERRLYMNVARWALQQKSFVCSRAVARNFGISIRLATNVVSMIHRRHSETIESTVKKMKKDGVVRTYIIVTNITQKHRKKQMPRKKEYDSPKDIKHWKNIFLRASV